MFQPGGFIWPPRSSARPRPRRKRCPILAGAWCPTVSRSSSLRRDPKLRQPGELRVRQLGNFLLACGGGTLLPDQQGKPRKQEVASSVVDDINLASIKAGFERSQRHIEFEDGSLALARVQFCQFYQGAFVGFGFTLEKGDVGQEPDAVLVIFISPGLRVFCRIRDRGSRRIVHFVVEKQVLRG